MLGIALARPVVFIPAVAVVVLSAALAAYLRPSSAGLTSSLPAEYTGTEIEARPAPEFRLTDARGQQWGPGDFRGRTLVMTFLDPRCRDVCPLIALELQKVVSGLGERAGEAAFLGVNTNPAATRPEDFDFFSASFGLDRLPNWHFVTGPPDDLEQVWRDYGIASVSLSAETLQHTSGVFIVDPAGSLRLYAGAPAALESGPRLSEILLQRLPAYLP